MNHEVASDGAKVDRWLVPIALLIGAWGIIFGYWLEALTSIKSSVLYSFGSGLFGIWLVRLADPKASRQLWILCSAGIGAISLMFLACAGVLVLADSTAIRDLGYLARLGVRGLGIGVCFAACIAGCKWLYLRVGVPLRDITGAKG